MYKTKSRRPDRFDFDLIIIGSGAGGSVAANIASSKGKKVAIIEDGLVGGESLNYSCIPTKTLLQSAKCYQSVKNSSRFGVSASSISYSYFAINSRKEIAIERAGTKDSSTMFDDRITMLNGHAHFLNPWLVSVAGSRFSAKNFLIATGSKGIVPSIDGLGKVGFVNAREATSLKYLPKTIFIIGGGATGCEFAQLFHSLDSKIYISDIKNRLLNDTDMEAGKLLADIFENNGISTFLATSVVKVASSGDKKIVTLDKDGKRHSVMVDEIIIATGKAPNLDLGLDNADVRYNRQGVIVDQFLRTSNKHIFAVGDVVGAHSLSHVAIYQSKIAIRNMYAKNDVAVDYRAVPRCIFTEPEIATVGQGEQELRNRGTRIIVGRCNLAVIGRSYIETQATGFVKVVASHTGVLLGATIASPGAGEMIHELALAIQKGLKAKDVAETIHAFPTWSEAIKIACSNIDKP